MRCPRSIAALATSLLRNALRRKAEVELAKLSDFTLRRLALDRREIRSAAEAYSRGACPPALPAARNSRNAARESRVRTSPARR
jgi:hypothetical protein